MRPEELDLWRRADALFARLLEYPPARRHAELERALGELPAESPDAPALRRAVERLLAAAERESGPLDTPIDYGAVSPLGGPELAPADSRPDLAGRRLGAYLLDGELGRGGMAVVYRAHRADGSFAQAVAVKVLGLGLLALGGDTRFRREQQLLARLRHPHIATMLDGGVADDGTPYLVMERIDGRPIDRYCREERLPLAARVALLLQVCEAVSFAHRNLVVHRDLKPGNILVDREGQVKLLDFGIAKLLESESAGLAGAHDADDAGDAGASAPTVAQPRFLTPGFAAPEQAEGGLVTTATDVFALGRILERLRTWDDAGDSTRTGGAGEADLRNIAGKAAHPEAERRYADAAAFAADLERWQSGRPVLATGDSPLYRLRKLLRRRRAAFAAGALVLAVALTGLGATLWQAERARREARAAEVVNSFLVDLFHASDPELAQGDDPRASELLARGAARARAQLGAEPLLEGQLLHVIGTIQREVGQNGAAEGSLARALELRERHLAADDPAIAATRVELGVTRYELGRIDEAVALLRTALGQLEQRLPPLARERLSAEVRLGDMLVVQGEFLEARQRMEAVLERIESAGSRGDELVEYALDAEYTLGVALGATGEVEAAERHLRRVVDEERRRSGGLSRDLALYLNEYGMLEHDRPDYAAAEAAYSEALAIKRRIFGEVHPQVAAGLLNLGMVQKDLGRRAEGLATLETAVAVYRRVYGDRHPQVALALVPRAVALLEQGRLQEARRIFEEAIGIWRALPPGSFEEQPFANALRNYGTLLLKLGEPASAEKILRESVARYATLELVDPVRVTLTRAKLGEALVALGRPAEGVPLLAAAVGELVSTHYGWERPGFVELQLALARGELALGHRDAARIALDAIDPHLASAGGPEWAAAREGVSGLRRELLRRP